MNDTEHSPAIVRSHTSAEGLSDSHPGKSTLLEGQTKLDRRQRKTRQAIYQAFEDLMAEMHYSAVTVVQIIERADIGRSTFYAHFETKEDLLDDMCTDMFGHVFEGVNEYCTGHADLSDMDLPGKLAHLLYHLRDSYSGVCGKLIAEGEPHFTARFKHEVEVLFAREASDKASHIPAGLLAGMQASAFMQAVTWWLEEGFSTTPEDLAGWFCETLRA